MAIESPLRLPSTLLHALPRTHSRRASQYIVRALRLLLLTVVLLTMAAVLAIWAWAPDAPLLYPLYSLHDDAYLILKGELYYRWFPNSAFVWYTISIVVAVAVISWALDVNILRWLQERTWRYLVHSPVRHPLALRLMRAQWWLKLPHVAREATRFKLEAAMHTMRSQTTRLGVAPERDCQRLVSLLDLHLTVEARFRKRRPDAQSDLQILERWQHSLTLLLALAPEKNAAGDAFFRPQVQTVLAMRPRVPLLPDIPDADVNNPQRIIELYERLNPTQEATDLQANPRAPLLPNETLYSQPIVLAEAALMLYLVMWLLKRRQRHITQADLLTVLLTRPATQTTPATEVRLLDLLTTLSNLAEQRRLLLHKVADALQAQLYADLNRNHNLSGMASNVNLYSTLQELEREIKTATEDKANTKVAQQEDNAGRRKKRRWWRRRGKQTADTAANTPNDTGKSAHRKPPPISVIHEQQDRDPRTSTLKERNQLTIGSATQLTVLLQDPLLLASTLDALDYLDLILTAMPQRWRRPNQAVWGYLLLLTSQPRLQLPLSQHLVNLFAGLLLVFGRTRVEQQPYPYLNTDTARQLLGLYRNQRLAQVRNKWRAALEDTTNPQNHALTQRDVLAAYSLLSGEFIAAAAPQPPNPAKRQAEA